MRRVIALGLLCLSLSANVRAGVTFGSKDSTFKVSSGTLALGTATLTDGTVMDAGGTATTTGGATCTGMTFASKDTAAGAFKAMDTDGTVVVGTSISLGDNEVLVVDGGTVAETVTVNGSDTDPSYIQGYGAFGGDIQVADDKELVMRWQGPLNMNVDLLAGSGNTTQVTLEHDLEFTQGKAFVGAGSGTDKVNCAGYAVSMGGTSVTPLNIAQDLVFEDMNLHLTGNASLASSKTLTSNTTTYLNGHGNELSMGNAFSTISNGGEKGAIVDILLEGYFGANLIGAGIWALQNVTFSASGEIVRVIDGTLPTGGSTNILSGNPTFGDSSVVELLSNAALGTITTGASTFNGNGHTLTAGTLKSQGNAITVTDMHLQDATITTTSSAITLNNVTFSNTTSDDSITISGGFASGSVAEPLAGALTLADNSVVSVNTDWAAGTMTFGAEGNLVGNGHSITAGTIAGGTSTTVSDVVFNGGAITNGGVLNYNNVGFAHGTGALSVQGALTTGADPIADACSFSGGTIINLDGSVRPFNAWTTGAACVINGGGHELDCANVAFTPTTSLYLNDITLSEMIVTSINNAADADVFMQNVAWYDGAATPVGAVRISGSPLLGTQAPAQVSLDTADSGLLFSATTGHTFNNGALIELLAASTLSTTWTFGGKSQINGGGKTLRFGSTSGIIDANADLYMNDITLLDVVTQSFAVNAATEADLYLHNVSWYDGAATPAGAVRISAGSKAATQGAAQVSLGAGAADDTDGLLFASNVTFENGADLELLSDSTISGDVTWLFSDNSVIKGNGCHLDLAAGILSIADEKTLEIRDTIIDNLATASFAGTGTVKLSNCTVILGAAVTWNALTPLVIDGPVTFVTGGNDFTAPTSATINGVTVWYDTLGKPDNQQVNSSEFTLSSNGRVATIPATVTSYDFTSTDNEIASNIYLYPSDGSVGATKASFTGDDAFVFDGHGRSMVLASTAGTGDEMITVATATTVTTENVVVDGFQPQHWTLTGTAAMRFGDKTIVRLQENWTSTMFDQTIYFGGDRVATEVMELDLNGYTIDMGDSSALLALDSVADAGTTTSSTLRIKNGTLTNVSGSKITGSATSNIIFQDVNLELTVASTDFDWGESLADGGALTFEGDCRVSGIQGNAFNYNSTDAMAISAGSSLTIEDGMVFNYEPLLWSPSNDSSRLILEGGTFAHPDASSAALVLKKGTIVVDHLSNLCPGADGISIGDGADSANDVTIEVRPGAQLVVATVSGASAGTLTYQNNAG